MSLRTPITLVVLTAVLVGAAYYGWQTVISPATKDDPPVATKPRCDNVQEFRKGDLIRAKDIVVNVYNAGLIANLAGDTLAILSNRGFEAGIADNAPTGVAATNVTILTDSRRAPQVKLVAQQFKGVVKYAKGNALDPGIDIVVGDDFAGMSHGAKRSLRVKHDVSTCAAVDTTGKARTATS